MYFCQEFSQISFVALCTFPLVIQSPYSQLASSAFTYMDSIAYLCVS